MTLAEQYREWLYENHSIYNGDMLINLEEDTLEQGKFLEEMGLPLYTEIDDE